jgi:anti-sigma B factor antagonist
MSEQPLSSEDEPFRIEIDERPDRAVVSLHGELDLGTVDEVEATIAALFERARLVILDLRPLAFMDSTAIRLMVAFDAMSRQDSVRFFIVRGGERIQRVLDVTGVADHLALIDHPDDATV